MEPNNTTREFNMFGYRIPDSVIHPEDFRFGFDPLWDGLYPDISPPPSLLTCRKATDRDHILLSIDSSFWIPWLCKSIEYPRQEALDREEEEILD